MVRTIAHKPKGKKDSGGQERNDNKRVTIIFVSEVYSIEISEYILT